MLPPDSSHDLDFDLGESITTLKEIEGQVFYDLFVMYCDEDIPTDTDVLIHPSRVVEDLTAMGYNWY